VNSLLAPVARLAGVNDANDPTPIAAWLEVIIIDTDARVDGRSLRERAGRNEHEQGTSDNGDDHPTREAQPEDGYCHNLLKPLHISPCDRRKRAARPAEPNLQVSRYPVLKLRSRHL
jgi:hypothetical protein